MDSQVKWCCSPFQRVYERAGDRSIAVLVDRYKNGDPTFILQARAFEKGQEPALNLPVAMSLVIEETMNYCPWCGTNLLRFYRKQIDRLARPDLKIEKGY